MVVPRRGNALQHARRTEVLCTWEFCPHRTPVKGTGTIISTSMKKLSHRSEMTCPYQPMIRKQSWPGTQAAWLPHHTATAHSLRVRQTQIQLPALQVGFLFRAVGLAAGPPPQAHGWGGLSTVPSPQGGSIQWAEHSTAIQCTEPTSLS